MKVTPKVMPIAKALALVETWTEAPPLLDDYDQSETEAMIAALASALAEAVTAGWETVRIDVDDNFDIRVEQETGVMVGWFLPEGLRERYRVDGGETDLHVTCTFLGDMADLTVEQTRILTGIVAEVASSHPAPFGVIDGTGTFENDDETVWFAVPHIEGLADFRERLVVALKSAGFEVKGKGADDWHPHITLGFLDPGEEPPAVTVPRSEPFMVNAITVAVGGTRFDVEFADNWEAYDSFSMAEYKANPDSWRNSPYVPFVKSVVEGPKRFTLGPWYVPNEEDAHGDWTDAEELQQALWGYVRSGYRGIRLQHSPDIEAGEWVEAMTLPWPMTVPVIDVNGVVTDHVYPAGTVLLGVVWEPWAWTLVLEGKITGYSIGGSSMMRDEAPPVASLA